MTPKSDWEDTRDHEVPVRRADDGALRLNPQRIKTWVTLAIAVIALVTLVWNLLASQVVRPRALKDVNDSIRTVRDQQETLTVVQTRQNARLTAVEVRLSRVEDALEILATDACLKRRQQPYEFRKLKCTEYLGD